MRNINDTRPGRGWPLLRAAAALTLVCLSPNHAVSAAKPPKPPPASFTHAFVRLGGLGGSSGRAFAINDFGQVVGQSDTAAGIPHAFIVVPEDTNGDGKLEWFVDSDSPDQNRLMQDLGTGPGFETQSSYATDVNDVGQVLVNCFNSAGDWAPQGFIINPVDLNNDAKPEWFLPDPNGANALMQPLSPGSAIPVTQLWVLGVNRTGQVVGVCNGRGFLLSGLDTDGNGVADLWYQDQNGDGLNDLYLDLGAAVGSRGYLLPLQPTCINDAGQLVGRVPMDPGATDLGDPFIITPRPNGDGTRVWNEDSNNDGINDLAIKLSLLRPGMWGDATAVNSTGVVAGWSQTPGGNPHAMMWRVDAQGNVTSTDLGLLQGEARTMAQAINDNLRVAGVARTYYMRKMRITESAFVWQDGVMSDLRDFVDQGALLEGRNLGALGINNAGMLVGWANDDVSRYPFIAVPLR